jgi:transcriptional regulator GlxA family with amidase domain
MDYYDDDKAEAAPLAGIPPAASNAHEGDVSPVSAQAAAAAWIRRLDAIQYYPRLKKAHAWVVENLDKSISVRQTARVACLETKYFSRYFHRKVGVTFTEYLYVLRVSRAAEMFRSQDHAVQDVAHATGFRSYRNFERWFKRLLGTTPRAFKRFVGPHEPIRLSPGGEGGRVFDDIRRLVDTVGP